MLTVPRWTCTGPRWSAQGAALGWTCPVRGERTVPLPAGKDLAFTAEGERHCTGVWRAGRRTPCPTGAPVPHGSANAQCADCARLDRSRSVAADTSIDDPRPYTVYLAYFGPGLLKVGITAVERGPVRLLEQGAVAYCGLGSGPLMAARRAEALLGDALGIKDRTAAAVKRAVRFRLPPVAERAAALAELHARAQALTGWPEALVRAPFTFADHTGTFGLDQLPPPAAEFTQLRPDAVVVGRVLATAGPDVYLRDPVGVALLDARLMSGWTLRAATSGERSTAPTRPLAPPAEPTVQDGLF